MIVEMNDKTHLVAGIATGIGISYFSQGGGTDAIVITSVATMAALAPDLDTAGSLTQRLTRPLRFVNRIGVMLLLIVFFASMRSEERRGGTGWRARRGAERAR